MRPTTVRTFPWTRRNRRSRTAVREPAACGARSARGRSPGCRAATVLPVSATWTPDCQPTRRMPAEARAAETAARVLTSQTFRNGVGLPGRRRRGRRSRTLSAQARRAADVDVGVGDVRDVTRQPVPGPVRRLRQPVSGLRPGGGRSGGTAWRRAAGTIRGSPRPGRARIRCARGE